MIGTSMPSVVKQSVTTFLAALALGHPGEVSSSIGIKVTPGW
jgi:hypothetical protein